MFELPAGLQGIGYLEGPDLYLWLACIVACFACGVLLLAKASKFEMPIQKRLFLGYALFCIFYGFTRIFFAWGVLDSDNYDYWTMWGYVTVLVAVIFLLGVLERYMLKEIANTHFLLTIASLVMLGVSMAGLFGLIERSAFLNFIYAVAMADAGVVAVLYLYLIVKGVGSVRQKMVLGFLGVLVLFLGMALDSEAGLSTGLIPLVIPPIVTMAGLLLFTYSQMKG
ncbi:MAG: hypothetical protein ACTSU5_14345 [Promethearchaeota archaeon]